jgi:hypothetical protein
MITLFSIALLGLALFFASLPIVLFALMLETCAERGAKRPAAQRRVMSMTPERVELEPILAAVQPS